MGYGDRVVQRGSVQVGVGRLVPAAVEVEELCCDLADLAETAHRLCVGVGDKSLVRNVEADHRDVDPALEHAPRGLGVGPDVELGGRGAVALADRSAHQHDPLRARVGLEREQERDVRQRPNRNHGELPVVLADLACEEADGMLGDRLARRRREIGAVETGLAVDVRRNRARPHERVRGALRDRHIRATAQLEHAQRVHGRLLDGLVADDGRHADELDLGRGHREHQRDRVVVAGVAVDEDRRRHQLFFFSQFSTSMASGTALWAPTFAAV